MDPLFLERLDLKGKVLPKSQFLLYKDLDPERTLSNIPEPARSALLQRAEAYREQEISFLPARYYLAFSKNGNRTLYEDRYFMRRRMLTQLVVGECIAKDGRFLDQIIDLIWAILEETSWRVPAHNNHQGHTGNALPYDYAGDVVYIDLFSAETGSALAFAAYFLQPQLDAVSPILCERIRYAIGRNLIGPFLTQDNLWWMGAEGQPVNNWNPWIISNILTVCALSENRDNVREAVVQKAAVLLDRFIAGYDEDGGCDEGPSYWGVAGGSLFDCLELLYDLTGGAADLFETPEIRAICRYIMNMNIHGDYFVNFADCRARITPSATLIARMGRRTGQPELMAFGAARIDDTRLDTAIHTVYRNLKNLLDTYEKPAAVQVPQQVWMPGIQVMTARSNTQSGRELFLAVKGGHNNESHNHNDTGSFVVYADGEPLLIDIGVGTYTAATFNENRYTIFTMQSSYHNLPDVNGTAQAPGREFHASDVDYSPAENRISMQLAGAYPPETGIDSYIRTAQLRNGAAQVRDAFRLQGPGNISLRYILRDRPEPAGPGRILLPGGAVLRYDQALQPKVEEIPLTDPVIIDGWQRKTLYRLTLHAQAVTNAAFAMTVEPAQ